MNRKRIVVLGAGPAGLWAARLLARRGFDVEVLERRGRVGGNAGSFEIAGLTADYGSHRLHPSTAPNILANLQELLGDDLLKQPRHGRINLLGRWIHFPLRPLDLALRAPPRFAFGVARDILLKAVARTNAMASGEETFASVLERGLGESICREFYFPYARKIWGLAPEEIAAVQAQRRVSAGTIGALLRRVLGRQSRKSDSSSKAFYFYPRQGFGQIAARLHEAAVEAGAAVSLLTTVTGIAHFEGGRFRVAASREGSTRFLEADHVWSTIPAANLVHLLEPSPPMSVLEAASRLELRAMVLVYLVIAEPQYSEFDAHYFPDPAIPFTRLSEPKNYAGRSEPAGRTLLCAEIPCSKSDRVWSMTDHDLRELVMGGLTQSGLPRPDNVLQVTTRRLGQAYPIYKRGYESCFDRVDEWLEGIDGILSFGRQGLFAHDNTHHTLFMAQSAVDCLNEHGRLDRIKWRRYRTVFDTHVVED